LGACYLPKKSIIHNVPKIKRAAIKTTKKSKQVKNEKSIKASFQNFERLQVKLLCKQATIKILSSIKHKPLNNCI
jgi:hypothetical protein